MAKKKTTTSNTSGTILTTSNTNISSSSNGTLWTTAGTTTSYTYYNPNINNQFVYNSPPPSPFSISFSWDGKDVNVSLKNGNDVFKLANAFMKWLDINEIEYSVKTKGRKKRR